ncbi:hypothetical protein LXL04_017145 [Taraxacum kok-saghyz]
MSVTEATRMKVTVVVDGVSTSSALSLSRFPSRRRRQQGAKEVSLREPQIHHSLMQVNKFFILRNRRFQLQPPAISSSSPVSGASRRPHRLNVKELWRICGNAGVVVDVYIGKSRNKQGQMYACVRFIRVSNSATLVQNLCKIRIGSLWLHANVAKHPRKAINHTHSREKIQATKMDLKPRKAPVNIDKGKTVTNNVSVGTASYASMLSKRKMNVEEPSLKENAPAFILDSEVLLDNVYTFAILGCFKDFRSIANIRCMCQGEGFLDIDPVYLGGLWVLLDFPNLEKRDLNAFRIGLEISTSSFEFDFDNCLESDLSSSPFLDHFDRYRCSNGNCLRRNSMQFVE